MNINIIVFVILLKLTSLFFFISVLFLTIIKKNSRTFLVICKLLFNFSSFEINIVRMYISLIYNLIHILNIWWDCEECWGKQMCLTNARVDNTFRIIYVIL